MNKNLALEYMLFGSKFIFTKSMFYSKNPLYIQHEQENKGLPNLHPKFINSSLANIFIKDFEQTSSSSLCISRLDEKIYKREDTNKF